MHNRKPDEDGRKRMKLQNLLMPQAARCTTDKMYFRLSDKNVSPSHCHQALTFSKGGWASLDTYFNGFSIEKWKKYTQIQNVSVTLFLKGGFEIQLCSKEKLHNTVAEKELSVTEAHFDTLTEVTLPFSSYEEKGMYYVKLLALSDGSEYCGGYYSADLQEDTLANVNLAINICTFRREAFVKRNLELLHREILNCEDNPLSRHLQIFISDNGKTLDRSALSDQYVHIVPNKNVGGAGGFTRGLIEILHCQSYRASHVLFMDDDILMEPEALFRTYTLLRCLKQEYKDSFIGGAMLRLDLPNIQVEAGAAWYAGALASRKSGLNVKEAEACLYNEIEEFCDFNAWWYCCVPMTVVREDNLPMPIFIRGDDVEYGLRNMKHLILLNGICVWHEPFENKYSSFLQYYILRNMLYDNALHCPGYSKKRFMRTLAGSVVRELFYYRYKNVDLIFRGVNDFFRGVDFLKETDGEKLHQDIMAAGYKAQPVESVPLPFDYPLYERSFRENDKKIHKCFRLLTFNGLILPAKRENIASMAKCRPINCYRVKRIMYYDITSKKAFLAEKKVGKSMSYLFQLCGLEVKTLFRFNRTVKKFKEQAAQVQNISFWKKYLGMEE